MSTSKVTITIDENTLAKLDCLVRKKVFPSRSRAIQKAIEEKLARKDRHRLAKECAKLDPTAEQALAEEGITQELDGWPEC
ncbi:MAG: ribbon-helix-helix domain-containing protein [Acidobacteria bacterium]|nr:ribbon-helix-helix domain-containing protein [Acidobacteriota bacterium]